MSMTDSAVFRNVKTQGTVNLTVATHSIGMPRDDVILDVELTTVAKDLRHDAVCPEGAKALLK
jgi:hypothetical protein